MQTLPQITPTPLPGVPKPRPRSGRTPLRPINSPADPIHTPPNPKPKPDEPLLQISPSIRDSDGKENRPIATATPPQAADPPQPRLPEAASSLAEELIAIKKKLERLRVDREKTDRALKEKEAKLDAMETELRNRGELQKRLEIEVDRLFRLNELKSRCMRVSPMRTLREKEQGKIVNEKTPSSSQQSEKKRKEETVSFGCESGGEECTVQSPGSACSQTENN